MKNTGKTETALNKHNYLKHIVIINKKNIYISIENFVFLFVFVLSVNYSQANTRAHSLLLTLPLPMKLRH